MVKENDAKVEKIVFFTSKSQLGKIDDFRFANRISSRAEAVRQLINRAFDGIEKKKSESLNESNRGLLMAAEEQKEYQVSDKDPDQEKKD